MEQKLESVFATFRKARHWHCAVKLRQERSRQLRQLLSDPGAIDIETFNREVWQHDNGAYLDDEDVNEILSREEFDRLEEALDNRKVEIHGNYVWRPATYVYAPKLTDESKKTENIHRALELLNDPSMGLLDKVRQMCDLHGFGPSVATGLVMLYHPTEFAVYNKKSRAALQKLGYAESSLENFQQEVQELRELVGAQDFLELDYFLYLISDGVIDLNRVVNGPPPERGPLNVILYGPPGTGKTYSTQRRAIEIVEAARESLSSEEVGERFREYREQGRIEFVTFHPSYSYEEFVEGFRYDEDKKMPILHRGIFEEVCRRADGSDDAGAELGGRVWKVSLGERRGDPEIFERCMKNGEIAVGWLPGIDLTDADGERVSELFREHEPGRKPQSTNRLVNEMQKGDYVAIYDSPKTVRAIGVITGGYEYKGEEDGYRHTRPVRWLDKQVRDIWELNGNTNLTPETIYELWRITPSRLTTLLSDSPVSKNGEPYVLVIDEINRGNISRIFGELITLLEPDKRLGAPNELSVRLPYSKKTFAVPSNLYIIGTMNTADRSIALLDVALRRRFEFEEMMPNVKVIREGLSEYVEAQDSELSAGQLDMICSVFTILNARITALLDRDHQIGHSYFLGIASMQDLRDALYRRIFPLLQEYFYNDPERLERLLGVYSESDQSGFIERIEGKFGKGFGLDDEVDEKPWTFHEYETAELELALRNTFLDE